MTEKHTIIPDNSQIDLSWVFSLPITQKSFANGCNPSWLAGLCWWCEDIYAQKQPWVDYV